jgi:predicted nuclease of predicted toxin-antitoxin system
VRLLFDQNLSHRLVELLAADFPACQHMRNVDLKAAPDPEVWEYAKAKGYTIVSKDADFHQRSLLFGPPPRVIWVRLGNCSTATIVQLLRASRAGIAQFEAMEEAAFLLLP